MHGGRLQARIYYLYIYGSCRLITQSKIRHHQWGYIYYPSDYEEASVVQSRPGRLALRAALHLCHCPGAEHDVVGGAPRQVRFLHGRPRRRVHGQ